MIRTMIKFTAVSIVLYLVNMFILKLYVRCSKGAAFRLKYDLYKGKEKSGMSFLVGG